MPWNANDASRQAVQRPAQQQQRSHRGNQQRAAGQMNDLLAQYRSALGGPAAGNSSWHSGPAGLPWSSTRIPDGPAFAPATPGASAGGRTPQRSADGDDHC